MLRLQSERFNAAEGVNHLSAVEAEFGSTEDQIIYKFKKQYLIYQISQFFSGSVGSTSVTEDPQDFCQR